MQYSKFAILEGVKRVVAQNGIEDFTTRKLSDMSLMNRGLIYHYFQSKEEVLLQAYCQENAILLGSISTLVDDVAEFPFNFEIKMRYVFHRIWKEFLKDPDRLRFCNAYYHSKYFGSAEEFHKKQLEEISSKAEKYFPSKHMCEQTLYSLLSLFYENAMRVVDGKLENTMDTEESIFSICFGMLNSQIDKTKVS